MKTNYSVTYDDGSKLQGNYAMGSLADAHRQARRFRKANGVRLRGYVIRYGSEVVSVAADASGRYPTSDGTASGAVA